jgi:pimeloyl-ACP methyl ester carboxylesterase
MRTWKRAMFGRRAVLLAVCLGIVALLAGSSRGSAASSQAAAGPRPTIVLVHGDWADASSWARVIPRLQSRSFNVVAPPNLLRGPVTDAAYLAHYLQTIPGPIVLVAHSYGGFVITNAATGNPNVKALVYIDSFQPAQGETAGGLTAAWHSCVNQSALNVVPYDGGVDLYLRRAANPPYQGYDKCFANGVPEGEANLLFATQRPAAVTQFTEPSGSPAWRQIPSWALIGTLDHVIPPPLQTAMARRAGSHTRRIEAGHLSLITRPRAVTRMILAAVNATT